MKYVLSTGKTTKDINLYIIDLFRIFTTVYKDDIPGSDIGYDFILSDVKKDELVKVVNEKCTSIVSLISDRVKAISGVTVNLSSIERVESGRFSITLTATSGIDNETELNVNLDI